MTVTVTAPTLAATGVTTGWFLWLALGLLVLGVVAFVVSILVRRRGHGRRAKR